MQITLKYDYENRFFSCTLALVKTSITMYNRSNESRHHCLIPKFESFKYVTIYYDIKSFVGALRHIEEVSCVTVF